MLWVARFNVCDLKLYQDRGNVILVKLKSGHVESIENIDLIYYNKHYELIVPLVYTDEQDISVVDDDDIHPECDSIYKNKTFASSIYQKQCPKSIGENTSYFHEGNHLPIKWNQN